MSLFQHENSLETDKTDKMESPFSIKLHVLYIVSVIGGYQNIRSILYLISLHQAVVDDILHCKVVDGDGTANVTVEGELDVVIVSLWLLRAVIQLYWRSFWILYSVVFYI